MIRLMSTAKAYGRCAHRCCCCRLHRAGTALAGGEAAGGGGLVGASRPAQLRAIRDCPACRANVGPMVSWGLAVASVTPHERNIGRTHHLCRFVFDLLLVAPF